MSLRTALRSVLTTSIGAVLPLVLLSPALAEPPAAKNFVAHLSGAEEVPERDCPGQGEAVFQLNTDGTELSYRVIASNIDNVVQSHIHLAPAGVNGPIVLFLYGLVPSGGGSQNGVLNSGKATASDLIGPLSGHPLSDLVTNLRTGGAYVNVHTNDGVSPTNTGCGDFPGGEIRGQIQTAGP
jgi:CHRD domain